MSDLRGVVVESPIGAHRFAEATQANFDESSGTLTLLRDVQVLSRLVPHDEYVARSQDPRHTLYVIYVGPHHASPGGLVFNAIPKRTSRAYGRS